MRVCRRCGKENQDHYKFCLGCGGEIGEIVPARAAPLPSLGADDLDPLAATAMSQVPAEEATDPMPPAAAVAAVAAPPAPAVAADEPGKRACPSCGTMIPAGFVFCGQCGTRIEQTPAPAPSRSNPPPATAPAARGKLILIRPDGSEGGSHPLAAGVNTIGRGGGSLFDADSYLSPRHAEIVVAPSGLTVRDNDSLNGVFVKLIEEEEIADSEIFRIGQELLRFDVIEPPVPLEDGTEVMGSPNPGYWGRVALIIGQEQDGSAFPLFGDAVILGRERGDILFPEDGYVSGTHARLSYRGGRFYLADLNSSNGTFLRVRGERQVRSGAYLLMGQQLFRVQSS